MAPETPPPGSETGVKTQGLTHAMVQLGSRLRDVNAVNDQYKISYYIVL